MLLVLVDSVEISHSWFLSAKIFVQRIQFDWLAGGRTMPGQVTALYCIVMRSTAAHWLYWVIRGRSLDNKDSRGRGGERGEAITLLQSGEEKRKSDILR